MTKETWGWTELVAQLDDEQRAALAVTFNALIGGHLDPAELTTFAMGYNAGGTLPR
jgi:hypothetical protein